MRIEKGKVAEIAYAMRLPDGELVEETEGETLAYLHGFGEIVPGLEQALDGKAVGEKIEVTVEPEDAYGDYDEDGVRQIPRDAFPEDEIPEEGDEVVLVDDEGDEISAWIVEIDDEAVHVDLNHPLAGETLVFEVEVKGVRDATAEELEHGHAHDEDHEHHHHHHGDEGDGPLKN